MTSVTTSNYKSSTAMEYINRKDRVTLGDVTTGLFIANEVDKHIHRHDDDYDEDLEREMDEYGLDEDEKDAIRSGDYTIENFDMDNWDEDNYYWDEDEDKPD